MYLLIFDLDGTLVDSKQDLIDSVNATRGFMNLAPLPGPTVARYVGRGAMALIQSALGDSAPAADVQKAHEFFIQYYGEHMLDKTALYPGVRESLDVLKDSGHSLAVLTNKPVRFSEKMMERLGLGKHFVRIYGGNSFEPKKKPDPVGIHALLSETGLAKERTIMVGDSARKNPKKRRQPLRRVALHASDSVDNVPSTATAGSAIEIRQEAYNATRDRTLRASCKT